MTQGDLRNAMRAELGSMRMRKRYRRWGKPKGYFEEDCPLCDVHDPCACFKWGKR